MSIEDLIRTQINEEATEFKKQQRKELEDFLNMNSRLDKDGSEFMKMLEKSKMHFGPYALQLAEEFFEKQMKMFRAKQDPSKRDEQEKISFVKMEVFLYGVSEANRLIEQLKSMEVRINKLAAEADSKQQEAEGLKLSVANLDRAPTRYDAEGKLRENRMRKIAKKAEEAVEKVDAKIQEQRHEISAKETELLLVFRELMGFDFYVPDYFFDKDYLLRKKEKQVQAEKYVMPLKTFWKPLDLVEEYYEHDMKAERYMKRVGAVENIDHTIGQFLAKPLRDSILRNEQAKIAKLREGSEVTSLYTVNVEARKDKVIFDKYMSHGQQRQDALLHESKKIIDQKTSRKTFAPDVPFQFTEK